VNNRGIGRSTTLRQNRFSSKPKQPHTEDTDEKNEKIMKRKDETEKMLSAGGRVGERERERARERRKTHRTRGFYFVCANDREKAVGSEEAIDACIPKDHTTATIGIVLKPNSIPLLHVTITQPIRSVRRERIRPQTVRENPCDTRFGEAINAEKVIECDDGCGGTSMYTEVFPDGGVDDGSDGQ
jgi:hypothetical protein